MQLQFDVKPGCARSDQASDSICSVQPVPDHNDVGQQSVLPGTDGHSQQSLDRRGACV